MGARTNWELTLNGKSVYLYSHWGGDTKLTDTRQALTSARPRWHDGTYAMRIFISQIVGTSWDSETGYGISTEDEFEENYTPARINFDTKQVTYGELVFGFAEFLEVN